MKHIILAIDSFKGYLSSVEAEDAVEQGLRERWQEVKVVRVPVTDGGDGTLEIFLQLFDCKEITINCHGALTRPIQASYAICADNTVVIETALSCGIDLLKQQELNPLRATTYGLGGLFIDALQRGLRKSIIGFGGLATSDCGFGMLAALKDILGKNWRDRFLRDLDITLASDVSNPLFGERGATTIFGPQKGATSEMIACLDRRARTFARMATVQLGFGCSSSSGAGAAGGLGYASIQFMNAEMVSGADVFSEAVSFNSLIEDADLIIIGEGSANSRTLMGKIPIRVLEYGLRKNVPVMLIARKVKDAAALLKAGFSQAQCIAPTGMVLTEAMKPTVAKENIREAVIQLNQGFRYVEQ